MSISAVVEVVRYGLPSMMTSQGEEATGTPQRQTRRLTRSVLSFRITTIRSTTTKTRTPCLTMR